MGPSLRGHVYLPALGAGVVLPPCTGGAGICCVLPLVQSGEASLVVQLRAPRRRPHVGERGSASALKSGPAGG